MSGILDVPYVLCVDVGSPKNIGWADSNGRAGDQSTLGQALSYLQAEISKGGRAALGFEAPIWTPRREELGSITGARKGIEKEHNRSWSASAGACVLGTALALMPWCFEQIRSQLGDTPVTIQLDRFVSAGGLLIWEAFVSGKMKGTEKSHCGDARSACKSFLDRWPELYSDIPKEMAVNHAVSCALAVGLNIRADELQDSAIVIGIRDY